MPRSRFVRLAALLASLAVFEWAPASAQADYSAAQLKADLKLFEDAKVPHGDKDLLAFFQSRLITEADSKRIEALIQQMSSKSFKEREQARSEVEKAGPPALPLLRKVLQTNVELEVKQRAERCIKTIEEKSPNALVTAAARILAHRQTDGALAVLMQYLAVAPDDIVEEQIAASIYGLALPGAKLTVLPPAVGAGKLDLAMVAALTDKHSCRRALAALVVARYGDAGQRGEAAKLLNDPDSGVRLRAAHGLATIGDKNVVPVLLELLDKAPLNTAIQAEDLLGQIAQEKGPTAPFGEAKEIRQKCHAAWTEWWDKNKDKLDLTVVEIESPFGGMVARASKGATQFVKVLLLDTKLDLEKVAMVTDVPFTIYGMINFSTRKEFDDFLKMSLAKDGGRPPQDSVKFKVAKVVPGVEYVKTAAENERDFLEKARVAQIHVVYLDIDEGMGGGQSVQIPFYIRISGGRARCLGLGQPQLGKQ